MSECVVRMEMPESCKKCKNPICLWLNDDGDFIVYHTIAAVQDFRKKNDDGFPYFCPILCQLPEGHGRLGDLDELAAGCDDPYWCRWLSEIEDAPTIVPAEAERSE